MRLRATDYRARPHRSIIPGSDNLSLWTSLYPRQHDGAGGAAGFMTFPRAADIRLLTFGSPAALRKIL